MTAIVHKWDIFETSAPGKTDGNPFADYKIFGEFRSKNEAKTIRGFYAGNGIYKVRFMPSFEDEEYTYRLFGSALEEDICGNFISISPAPNSYGPVRVTNTYHFSYEDGSRFYPLGTTCYVWQYQDDETISKTLESLKASGFNKLRFCIFPKHYDYNLGEPRLYPFEGTPMDSSVLTKDNFQNYTGKTEGNNFDFSRPNIEYFDHLDKCILALQEAGIEADLILFHPYDRWGFSMMSKEEDAAYLRYIIARLAAYRNIWWAMANEYDLFTSKDEKDWEDLAKILCKEDPYNHLRSIHNCRPFYNHSKPWITHCSIQRQDLYKSAEFTDEWRARYQKPVVLDEIAYEGNIQYAWGNISGQELIRRYWEAVCRGGYPGHGETYIDGDNPIWWSHGGELKGESWKRVKFLQEILNDVPGIGLAPGPGDWDDVCAIPENFILADQTGYKLYYYGNFRPSFREFCFDEETLYQAEVIDTWNMTISDPTYAKGKFNIPLPGREYLAIRLRKAPDSLQ